MRNPRPSTLFLYWDSYWINAGALEHFAELNFKCWLYRGIFIRPLDLRRQGMSFRASKCARFICAQHPIFGNWMFDDFGSTISVKSRYSLRTVQRHALLAVCLYVCKCQLVTLHHSFLPSSRSSVGVVPYFAFRLAVFAFFFYFAFVFVVIVKWAATFIDKFLIGVVYLK